MGHQTDIAAPCADDMGVRPQYAALCWRHGAVGVEVLLITSRDTGRWVLPKGWPIVGISPAAAAAREAWEEAGVEGVVGTSGLGHYGYLKEMGQDPAIPCTVSVYDLQVDTLAAKFPEKSERRREWFALDIAAGLVREPDLAALIRGFVPSPTSRPPAATVHGSRRPD